MEASGSASVTSTLGLGSRATRIVYWIRNIASRLAAQREGSGIASSGHQDEFSRSFRERRRGGRRRLCAVGRGIEGVGREIVFRGRRRRCRGMRGRGVLCELWRLCGERVVVGTGGGRGGFWSRGAALWRCSSRRRRRGRDRGGVGRGIRGRRRSYLVIRDEMGRREIHTRCNQQLPALVIRHREPIPLLNIVLCNERYYGIPQSRCRHSVIQVIRLH